MLSLVFFTIQYELPTRGRSISSTLSEPSGKNEFVNFCTAFFTLSYAEISEIEALGLLALFGAPVSSIMDADNAVQAALAMKNSLATVNEYFARKFDASISIGISIHTGKERGRNNFPK